eukprot:TRINITY_DN5079_c1_g2_i1.p9 TRINITY_DN5079_c1_g2~~TRINITY_DN5079_c1_g2_i1.p9  ORF type:complete len:100 (-),score=8.41 TRINITY_DN5079_c1_g2_i1:1314-1613(-)
MAVKLKIKKGDTVKIIAGDDKGKTGEVLAVLPAKNKVIVKDCKVAKKTVKPDQEKNPEGGFVNKEMPIDISNVAKVEGEQDGKQITRKIQCRDQTNFRN